MVDTTLAPDYLTVAQTAERLGVTPSRVRALIENHQLRAARVGLSSYFVLEEDVERRVSLGSVTGRPLSPRNAWAVIMLAAGMHPEFVDRQNRHRLRQLLGRDGLAGLRIRLRTRGRSVRLRAHPGELARVANNPGLVLTGAGAAAHYRLGLSTGEAVEGYVRESDYERVVSRHHLREWKDTNVLLRVVPLDDGWSLGKVAPLPAVALDLAEDSDPRAVSLGSRLLNDPSLLKPADR